MTFPDPRLESSFDLAAEGTRPLTEGERKAADRNTGVGERIYAPASERVPREPVPGHRGFIDHTDARTPERQAAVQVNTMENEPTFTRIARPSSVQNGDSEVHNNQPSGMPFAMSQNPRNLSIGIGVSWLTVICCSVGVVLVMRWQRERNKPINRLRRQAARAAEEFRNRAPTPREAAKPAMGLGTALLSLAVLVWQQSQQRSHTTSKQMTRQMGKQSKQMSKQSEQMSKRAARAVAETDWQKRLMQLKDRWNPARLELEKIQISRR